MEHLSHLDLAQNAKMQWRIKGDENSGYFHRIINHKRWKLAIHGIMIDGVWVNDPIRVKHEFFFFLSIYFFQSGWT